MIQKELRNASRFQGYVVSDCGAIGWMGPSMHNYTKNDAESSAAGIKAGTDLDCGGAYGDGLGPAISGGMLSEAELDVALGRSLTARVEMGTLDPPGTHPYQRINMRHVETPLRNHECDLSVRLPTTFGLC